MTNREFARFGAPEGWEPPRRKRTREKTKKTFDVPGSVEYWDLDEAFPDGIDPEDDMQTRLLSDDCRMLLDAEARAEYEAYEAMEG